MNYKKIAPTEGEGYCMKCRNKVKLTFTEAGSDGKHSMMRGSCKKCGTKVFRTISRDEFSRITGKSGGCDCPYAGAGEEPAADGDFAAVEGGAKKRRSRKSGSRKSRKSSGSRKSKGSRKSHGSRKSKGSRKSGSRKSRSSAPKRKSSGSRKSHSRHSRKSGSKKTRRVKH
jgi:hypothetical protein